MVIDEKIVMSVIVLLIILLPVSVFADFGPKPTLSILIKNSKDEACFVTLACDPDTENPDPDKMYLYTDGNIYAYLYKDPSYIATSYVKSNDYFDMKIDSIGYYNITGLGIPYAFNLVLQYESGEVVVSDLGTNDKFYGLVLFDAESGSVKNITALDKEYYMFYYKTIIDILLCVVVTLVVEILISLPFRIKPLKVLVLANIATQILLHTVIFTTYHIFSLLFIFVFLICEIMIWVIEYLIYKKFAKSLSGKSIGLYVFIANLVSMLLSFLSVLIV